MKKNTKILTGALLMALMCAGAAVNVNTGAKVDGLQVRDVLDSDVTKDVTGKVVRKVDAEAPVANNVVSDVKAQVSPATDGKRSIRFVAALDSYLYDSAKFDVVVKDGDTEVKSYVDKVVTTAYTHVVVDGVTKTAAEAFGSTDYNYMIAFTINNVPESAWGYTFEVTASIKTADATAYTTTDVASKVMNDMVFVDAIGGSGIFTNITNETSGTTYAWSTSVVDGVATMDSTNDGVSSSKSSIKFEVAKDSVVSFDYSISSEKNYDKLFVYTYATVDATSTIDLNVSGDSSETLYTGTYVAKLAAGNVIEIVYSKDSSGNRGLDHASITNLSFTDGIPAVNITKVHNDGVTPDATASGELVAELGSDVLATPENVRGDNYQFDAWYYDAEFTKVASATDVITKVNVTLYAKWLEKVTVNFVVPEGATEVASVTTWTDTPIDVTNPTKPQNIFRGWYLEEDYTTLVDIATDGVSEGCTLYAKFEELPTGASRDVAHKVVFDEGTTMWGVDGVETTKEFQDYYFEFTPTVTTEYFVIFENYSIVGKNDVSYNYASYARMWIEDANGNVVYKDFSNGNTQDTYNLEAGKTYYFVFNGSKYSAEAESWGTFDFDVMYFNHNSAETAFDYPGIDQTVTIAPGTFTSEYEEFVYKYTATSTGNYRLVVESTGWAQIDVYEGSLDSKVTYTSVYNASKFIDVEFEAGKTYYFKVGQNWNTSELATKEIKFTVATYGVGYTSSNPNSYNVGDEITVDFTGGYSQYDAFTLTSDSTIRVSAVGGTSSYTKEVTIYDVNDMSTALVTISGATTDELVEYVNLSAGDYVIKSTYTSTSGTTNYTVTLAVAATGESLLNPESATLPADNNVVPEMTTTGYYSFSTGSSSVFHFFTADDTTAVIKIMKADGTVVATSKNGEVYAKLDTETDYIVYVECDSVAVTYKTEENVIDGTSVDTAYIYGTSSNVLYNDTTGSYTVYYKFTATETGTYAFYTLNNGSIDPKIYVYAADGTTQVGYNDDDKSGNVTALGGYKYDSYATVDVTAGETYYLKVTYSVNSANVSSNDIALTVNVSKN